MLEELTRVIAEWLACERDCACGRPHRVGTQIVRFDDSRGSALIETLRELDVARASLVVGDVNTQHIAVKITGALRCASVETAEHVFESPVLVADETSVGTLSQAIESVGPQCVIGVGSGTINDICKAAATARGTPYISYPTAASMNGYTSAVASLKRGGLKVTDPVDAPVAVVVDLDVICQSPRAMTAAGVADLLSKFVCNADWILARVVEGGYYCDASARLAALAAEAVIHDLDDIAAGTKNGSATLTAALVLSGIAMAAAGSSSPASGGEHLISHYWDMRGPEGRRLHGAQVGLGTLLCARLYETLAATDPATIDPAAVARKLSEDEPSDGEIREHFADAAPAVIEQAERKRRSLGAAEERAAFIRDNWSRTWSAVDPILKSAEHIRTLLSRAGAPTTLRAIGLNRPHAADALRWARHIRARYTIFDFAAEIGAFDERNQYRLLNHSGLD